MAEVVVTFFIAGVVIMVTALIFSAWLIVSIVRVMFRMIVALFSPAPSSSRRGTSSPPALVMCTNARCRGPNPPGARFCRRCGVALPAAQRVAVRRAAMW